MISSSQPTSPAGTDACQSSQSLNGLWHFEFLGDVPVDDIDLDLYEMAELMPVPSAFDALPAYSGKRGAAVYRRTIEIPAGHSATLRFGAVSMWCRVYLDGVPVKEHRNGYAPFEIEIPPSAYGRRELTVLVDNRFCFDRTPMHEEYFDFYQYGGILRDVSLLVRPAGGYIEAVSITPTARYDHGEIEVLVALRGRIAAGSRVRFSVDGSEDIPAAVLSATGDTWRFRATVPDFRLWSPESPGMHSLTAELRDGGDTPQHRVTERFGLRRITTAGGKIFLNGRALQLRGYNRHEWHPNFGPCTPTLQMVADLQLMKELGCNFVRGCHYPQDKRFLDLCDEYGFLVWEENLGWGQRENTFRSERFLSDHADTLRQMIRASYNHPCIIIRGFLNEAGTDQEYARTCMEESAGIIREMDPSRLISYATMFASEDLYYHLVDIISLNLYPGWYNCEGVDDPISLIKKSINDHTAMLDEKGWGEKPILISEIGAEGLYGWHDSHNDFFTEEHQAEYLRTACESILGNERCCGVALWHFSDVRTYSGGWSLKRPRTYNNKGTLDEYRRRKLAFAAVREVFAKYQVKSERRASGKPALVEVAAEETACLGV